MKFVGEKLKNIREKKAISEQARSDTINHYSIFRFENSKNLSNSFEQTKWEFVDVHISRVRVF